MEIRQKILNELHNTTTKSHFFLLFSLQQSFRIKSYCDFMFFLAVGRSIKANCSVCGVFNTQRSEAGRVAVFACHSMPHHESVKLGFIPLSHPA